MSLPKLKRTTIHSELELDVWLANNSNEEKSVMLVTHAKDAHPKFVSHEQVGQLLTQHGWKAGSRYTMGPDLIGHVITQVVS